MGIQILSTPRGVLSDRRARTEKVGGEVLALIHLRLSKPAAALVCSYEPGLRRDKQPHSPGIEEDRTMSRIGRKPVPVPPSVKVSIAEQTIEIEGPEGEAQLHAPARDRSRLRPGRRADPVQAPRRRANQSLAARADSQPGCQHGAGCHDGLYQEARDRRRRLPGSTEEGQHDRACRSGTRTKLSSRRPRA